MAATNCGMIGVLNNNPFKVLCSNAATLIEASRPNAATEWTDLKNIIGTAATLLNAKNTKILPANNYQDGWWIRAAEDTDGTTNGKTMWTYTAKTKRDMCPNSGC